jgi:hypothetical protein
MRTTSARGTGSSEGNRPVEQPPQVGSGGSGEGAASALTRMKSQHEHLALQKPPEDPGHACKHDGQA